jgi:two-component system nitrogen regulation sensor histidine kinase GlnL
MLANRQISRFTLEFSEEPVAGVNPKINSGINPGNSPPLVLRGHSFSSASHQQHLPGVVIKEMEQYRRIFENLNTAILTLDNQLRITSANPACEMLFARSRNQLNLQPISSLIDTPQLMDSLNETLKSDHPLTVRSCQLILPNKNESTVDYTITPINDAKTADVMLLELNPIDRLMRLAREDKILNHQVTNRAVIRGLAHEVKNPLGGIRGAAQLLEKELSDKNLHEYTDVIIQEVDRLRALVDRMFGPNQPLEIKAISIHEILEHVARLLLAEAKDGIHIHRDYDPSLPAIEGDKDQLTQAILNLARNSLEAMNNHGELIFRTRVQRQFTIGSVRHRLVIQLDIEDNGPGIPADIIESIFYPMVTNRPEGTGLGLSIAQDIVAKHGGLIEVTSQPGQTIFSVFLPLELAHVH